MSERLRSESGQVIPFVGILLLTTLVGVCAFAIDVGVWLKASRHAQGVADAAALAAVQDLPLDPAAARATASAYARTNDGALERTPTVSTTDVPNDTISVRAVETAPSLFARVFGIESMTVRASAEAVVAGVGRIDGAGFSSDGTGRPIPLAVGAGTWRATPLGQTVTLVYGPAAAVAGGQFGLVDFANEKGGTPPRTIADWVENGYDGTLGVGTYGGVTGNKFMPAQVRAAFADLIASGRTVTMPVFSGTNGANGGRMTYSVVGWAAFKPTAFSANGGDSTLTGSFVSLQAEVVDAPPAQYFGVGRIKLTK